MTAISNNSIKQFFSQFLVISPVPSQGREFSSSKKFEKFRPLESHSLPFPHLDDDVGDDDEERVGEVEEEPDLHRLDSWSAGEAGGD